LCTLESQLEAVGNAFYEALLRVADGQDAAPFDAFKEEYFKLLRQVKEVRKGCKFNEAICEFYLEAALRLCPGFKNVKTQAKAQKAPDPFTGFVRVFPWDNLFSPAYYNYFICRTSFDFSTTLFLRSV
jgi:hypothetical protein